MSKVTRRGRAVKGKKAKKAKPVSPKPKAKKPVSPRVPKAKKSSVAKPKRRAAPVSPKPKAKKPAIPRNTPKVKPNAKAKAKARERAKRGWETRRAKEEARKAAAIRGWETRRARRPPAPEPIPELLRLPPRDLAREKRREAALLGWERRREREAIQAAEVSPPMPDDSEFRPLYELGSIFAQSIYEREAKYPRVEAAVDRAIARTMGEREAIFQGVEKWSGPAVIRGRMLDAYVAGNFDDVAGDLADEYDMDVNEVYDTFFSPEAV